MIPIRDNLKPSKTPYVTLALISLNIAVFLLQISLSERALNALYHIFGIIPARFFNPFFEMKNNFPTEPWVTIFTSMFIHGGILHIFMNMWILYIFGNDVEDKLGHFKFLILYLGSGIIAALTHIYIYPNSYIPTIGASGAVAGIMGAYYLLFPFAKLDVLIPIFFYIDIISIPAFMFLPIWFIEQLFSGTLALASINFSNVAFWAHIGGFIGGLWLTFALALLMNSINRNFSNQITVDNYLDLEYSNLSNIPIKRLQILENVRPVVRPTSRKIIFKI